METFPGCGRELGTKGTEVPARDSAGIPTAQEPTPHSAHAAPGLELKKVHWRKSRPNYERRRILNRLLVASGIAILMLGATVGWLAYKVWVVRSELTSAALMIPDFKKELAAKHIEAGRTTLDRLQDHTRAAKAAVSDPIWKAAAEIPWLGPNFAAVGEVAVSSDDVASSAAEPLLKVLNSLGWEDIAPVNGKFNVAPLAESSSSVVTAANTVELTYARLHAIDSSELLPEVRKPLSEAVQTLDVARGTLSTAAEASRILPSMLGSDGPRNYLVLVQNNSEVRATGGLPGALALIHVENGAITLRAQSSGATLGKFDPPVAVETNQTQLYSYRLGTYIGDVNLTPDFPSAARSAKAMWERRHGGFVDGVVALDPVVLAHILDVSGPIAAPSTIEGMPTELTAGNVVQTLLSDVYTQLPSNDEQDAYFASVSREIFTGLASGNVPGEKLVSALTRSAGENRLYVWSVHNDEQKILASTPVGGAVSGPSVGGTSFGVYFNDGTGAKMDFYVKRTVQLIRQCRDNGYAAFKVRIVLHNTVQSDAAAALPSSVTGGGRFGTPAGTIQTNIVVYGPAQARIETVYQDKIKSAFGSQLDRGRPVGTLTTRLKPGQKSTVEFTFGQIVQKDAPALTVTPTVQPVADVVRAPESTRCMADQ